MNNYIYYSISSKRGRDRICSSYDDRDKQKHSHKESKSPERHHSRRDSPSPKRSHGKKYDSPRNLYSKKKSSESPKKQHSKKDSAHKRKNERKESESPKTQHRRINFESPDQHNGFEKQDRSSSRETGYSPGGPR